MTTLTQQASYLRSQRNFPNKDVKELSVENDRAYIDIAQKVNARTIGTFALGNQIVTGEQWYLEGSSKKQQTLRQVYVLDGTNSIGHGINFAEITAITRIYGTFTDGANWYTLPYVDISNTNKQINVTISESQIIINAGASAPVFNNGIIVLEWLSNV